ncbi:MAG: hypothetical protein HYU63_04035 [Armatimonadetes bacterium]|nr:hypothetical protein [Armatimonadota bacterium]
MQENLKKFYFFSLSLYFIIILVLAYFIFLRNDLNENPINPRLREDLSKRGNIYDRHGEILAKNINSKRFYPQGEILAQTIGYDDLIYGKYALEDSLDKFLRYKKGFSNLGEFYKFLKIKKSKKGNDCFLSIDLKLQKRAYELLRDQRGAIIALQPQTGEILVLASSPSFNPNYLKRYLGRDNYFGSPFLNRALEGLYPPGSTFKLYTLAIALEEGLNENNFKIYCPGYLDIGNYRIHEAEGIAHGKVDLREALIYSCNVAFAKMAIDLGKEKFSALAGRLNLTHPIDFILPNQGGNFPSLESLTPSILSQSAFGQGEIIITPFRMALICSIFANQGKIMSPYILSKVKNFSGETIFEEKPKVYLKVLNKDLALKAKGIMFEVVEKGTGQRARLENIKVGGKTGTAENPKGIPHAWFVGFAPIDVPKILVCVILENSGYGGLKAAPLAREIIKEYFKK